ncbi:MAG: AAA family ATPase [Acidimicrobiales bacterium]
MRVTRVYLQNYRVYEEPVDLEIPPGLVGIYGPNGSGKSYLVESLRFALYGRSRTANEEVRTADVKAECVAEIEFEHEGHLYVVRRTVSGANATMKASAFANGLQVAEGVRDTSRYVQSILGMDDTAFRASVFAEQKQLSAFSSQPPSERRRLVLQLLGITPLDVARDNARRDARQADARHQEMRAVLVDLVQLAQQVAQSEEAAAQLVEAAVTAEIEAVAAKGNLDVASARHDELDVLRQEHALLQAEAKSVATTRERASATVDRLAAELAALDASAARLSGLEAEAEGWREAEGRLRLVEAVVAAAAVVEAAAVPVAPQEPDEEGTEEVRLAGETARAELAAVNGRLEGARAELARAHDTVGRAAQLTGEADCPLCGQALGDAYSEVQAHRASELAEAQARVTELEIERARLAALATDLVRRATEGARALRDARGAWEAYQQATAERSRARQALAEAEAVLGRTATPAERAEMAAEVERRRRAADECLRLRGRLERREQAVVELDVANLLVAENFGRLDAIADKIASLGFRPDDLDATRAARHQARLDTEETAFRAQAARLAATEARARAAADRQRLADAAEQHARLDQLADEARHLGRLAELLNAFRNTQVAAVGPRLSTQAAELFGELTDHEYDQLHVDPDTFEIKISDAGLLYGMGRFSGSEIDLANLALRVAISEHVRFQSGGAVGLLVLDEVFGPLDDDRKDRMLLALERLRGRFRQILVVTHDTEIKHQLPNAIEVVKLPGRRATARLVAAGA